MVTLYKRATPSQRQMLRIIEGAVNNVHDAHNMVRSPRFARSIAKRAAGTLSAQLTEVLARDLSASDQAMQSPIQTAGSQPSNVCEGDDHGDRLRFSRRSPLQSLWETLHRQIKPLRINGQHDKAEAYIDVLKMIAALQRKINER